MNKKYADVKLMYLEPIFSDQKSFYGKAKIIVDGESTILTSYTVKIAEIENGKLKMLCEPKDLSNTTLKHLREFLNQFGYGTIAELTKKQIIKELYQKSVDKYIILYNSILKIKNKGGFKKWICIII